MHARQHAASLSLPWPGSVCLLHRRSCHNVYAATGAGASLSYLFRWQLIKRVYVARQWKKLENDKIK